MKETDLDEVLHLTKEVHGNHLFEPKEVFAERLALFPQGAFILERDGVAIGYGMVHPIYSGHPPKLCTMLGSMPKPGDENVVLYVYDIALGAAARGQGYLRQLIQQLPCQVRR
jgi:predicted GNAT superfamily acetyltransferase